MPPIPILPTPPRARPAVFSRASATKALIRAYHRFAVAPFARPDVAEECAQAAARRPCVSHWGDSMKRMFAVLLLAALSCADCHASGGLFSWLFGPSVDDRGCCGQVNDPYACGGCCPRGGCAQGGYGQCGCGQCGCGDECGYGQNCGGNSCMFNRYCGPSNTVGCGPSGPYDYGACGRMNGPCGCGHGCGHGGADCGCSCCSQPPAGGCCQPCCPSGDHMYNFAPGPPTAQTAYPYYTTRGPRDFLMGNPPPIGPY